MSETEKSREQLIVEVATLRRELEDRRNHRKTDTTTPQPPDTDFCTTLIREVPEYLYSIEFSEHGIVAVFHSPQCEKITGYSPSDYATNPNLWMDMIHVKDRERVRLFLQGLTEPLTCKSIEHRIIRKDGSVRWVLNMSTVHTNTDGATLRQSGFLIDVTGRREADERNQQLLDTTRRDSLTDDLTQLYNRRAFRVLAEQQVRIADRINHPVLLIFIDVDGLKFANDTFGHQAGDRQLIDLAAILKSTFRESDIIARMGGDEFAVLSMEMDPATSLALLERLRVNIDKRNAGDTSIPALSVSAGVSRYTPNQSDSIAGLLDRADKAMYTIKGAKSRPHSVSVNSFTARETARASGAIG